MGGAPSRVLEGLWLGGADVVDEYDSFAATHDIGACVSLGAETPPNPLHEVLHLDVADAEAAALGPHLERIVRFIHRHRVAGRGVYVHCHAGISRSGAAVAAYLMAHADLGPRDALAHVIRCRDTCCPNPGFRRQLLRWDAPACRDRLREDFGPALVRDDLADVCRGLEQARARVRDTRRAPWLMVCNGRPPPDGAAVAEDDRGVYVVDDGERRAVEKTSTFLDAAERDWRDADAAPFDVLDFEGQVARLSERLRPLLRAGRKPGGKAGLAWLADAADAGNDAALPRHDPEARIRRQVLEECAPGGVERSRGGGERGDDLGDDLEDGECAGGCGFFPARNQRFCLHCKAARAADDASDDSYEEEEEE